MLTPMRLRLDRRLRTRQFGFVLFQFVFRDSTRVGEYRKHSQCQQSKH